MKKIIVLIGLLSLAAWNFFSDLPTAAPDAAIPVVEKTRQAEYYVFITGAVKKPGLYAFTQAVTAGEAVQTAGGALPYAEVSVVNLAAKIEDGQQIHVPYNLDGVPAVIEEGKININEADEKKLSELPGIGPAMAQRILEYREEHGSFSSIEDLQQVKGIGAAKYEKLKDKVSV